MKLSMKEILDKYADCDTISLTGITNGYKITEKDFDSALERVRQKTKDKLKSVYNEHLKEFDGYPSFNELYSDIERECYLYNSEENKEKYLKEKFDKDFVYQLKQNRKRLQELVGKLSQEEKDKYFKEGSDFYNQDLSEEEIKKAREDFFHCHFIVGEVGTRTRYSNENNRYIYAFYSNIAMLLDMENEKRKISFNKGNDLLLQVPESIRGECFEYEVSFYNQVNESMQLMVNYYFPLNEKIKKYLLEFETDFDLLELQDLTMYQSGEVKFYSCTHEKFNSINE